MSALINDTPLSESATVDEKAVQPFPRSTKSYIEGSRPDINVPMRRISQHNTTGVSGSSSNPDILVYDTSGPYTDPKSSIDLRKGLAGVRDAWIDERGDTETLSDLSSQYGRARAADGELSRLNKKPSYTGRYYDSIADIILNFCFLLAFWYVTEISIIYMLLAFFGIQLQGTVYNYYYVILRNSVEGDSTSRIFEDAAPKALKGESQRTVNIFYKIYNILYITFDKIMYHLDKNASESPPFPKWFMTLVSMYGLGFQLLFMSLMLTLNLQDYVIPFFIVYSTLIFVFVGIRKKIL